MKLLILLQHLAIMAVDSPLPLLGLLPAAAATAVWGLTHIFCRSSSLSFRNRLT